MKTLIIFLLAFLSCNVYTQNEKNDVNKGLKINSKCLRKGETKVFVLDLSMPNKNSLIPKNLCLKNKALVIRTSNLVALELVNGNPYKYDYVINHELIDFYNEDLNKIEDQLKKATKNKGKLNENEPQKEIEKLNEEISKKSNSIEIANLKIRKAEEELKIYRKYAEELINKKLLLENKIEGETYFFQKFSNNEQSFSENFQKLEKANEHTVNELNMLIKDLTPGILKYEKIINDSKFSIKNKKLKLNELEKQRKVLKEEEKKFKKIEKDKIERDKLAVESKLFLIQEKIKSLKENIDNYLLMISAEDYLNEQSFKKMLNSFSEEYRNIVHKINNISQEASLIVGYSDGYNKKINNLENNEFKNVKILLNEMKALKFKHYTQPIDFNGENIDVIEFSISRKLKKRTNQLPEKDRYDIWLKGGIKIDVSAGVFISSLVDREYLIINKTDTNNTTGEEEIYQVITSNNIGNYQYGFGSLVNVTPRLGISWAKPSFNFGIMFSNEQNFQFLLGGGVVLGKKQRFLLHGGLALGNIKRIRKDLTPDGETRYSFSSNDAIPTQNDFSFGHFFGVTYNLGKVKSQQEKK